MTTSLTNSNQVDVSHLNPSISFIGLDTDKNSKIRKSLKK